MKMPFLNTSLLLSCALTPLLANADSWPQYRGPVGDGKSAEALGEVSATPKVLWKRPSPLGFSSFSIAGSDAFTIVAREAGGKPSEVLVAVDTRSGDERWSVALGSSEYEHGGGNAGALGNKGGDGPRSTPSIDGGRVYVYDSHMVLSCVDAKSGDLVWRRDIVGEFEGRNIKWLNATSPVLDGDVIYIGGGGAGQTFLSFDKTTGKVRWKSGDEMITHATPHLTTIDGVKQIIYFCQSGLISLDTKDGTELWRSKFKFSVSTAASPISEGNLVYCSAGYGVGAALFDVKGNSEAKELWYKPNELMNHWSTPVVHDGHLYGIFEFKKYGKAPLQCVDLASGEIKWTERGFGPGNCILVDGKLIVLSDAGELVVVDAKPDAYKERSRSKVLSGKCWTTPAFSDGHVYIRSTEEAACVQLSGS